MISFADALALLLQATPSLPAEHFRIEEVAGRVLRAGIRTDRPFPPFDRVMMDGYALRQADLLFQQTFRVTGSAAAGHAALSLARAPGSCVEVMTGAPLPIGADCIVPVEATSRHGENEMTVAGSARAQAGQFIHRTGSDAVEGELLIPPGTRMGSRELGVAASCGAALLEVSRLPRISLITTGDELVPVDVAPAPHQIRQSNGHALRAALTRAGYPSVHRGTLGDDADAAALRGWIEDSDWVILTGAVSKGARDFLPAMLDALGCTRVFHGVAQRPGKPVGCWIGPDGQMILALPGNPVSALTGLHVLLLPALEKASGLTPATQRQIAPRQPINQLAGMTVHLPVTLDNAGLANPAPTGNSGDFTGLLRSDGILTLPPRGEDLTVFSYTPWL